MKEGYYLTIDKALQTASTWEFIQQQLNGIHGNDLQNKSTTYVLHIHKVAPKLIINICQNQPEKVAHI